jgi:hypothetical protein
MEDFIIDSKTVSCEPTVFKGIIERKKSGRVPFTLEKFGTRKFILVGDRYAYAENNGEGIDTGLSTKDFIAFISGFKRSLNSQLKKNPSLLELNIAYESSVAKKFHNTYDALLEGENFYNIDLSSAYWQIANRLGYISKKVFERYIFLDEYKHAKRLCISFLGRRREKIIYEVIDGTYTEKKEVLSNRDEKIFVNIRHELYTIINDIVMQLGDAVIEYNTDGISVLSYKREQVENYFTELGLIFKVNNCVKRNNIQYLHNTKLRNFKIQRNDSSRTN